MKYIITILFCLTFAASVQAGISFNLAKDPRKWTPQTTSADSVERFFLQGDSIEDWKEMVSLEFASNQVSLRKFVDTWKGELLKADPKIDIKEEAVGDDSIIITYTSLSAYETCIRKFIKDEGEVIMLTYHVRPMIKKDETIKIWEEIIRGAISTPIHLPPNGKTFEIAN